MPGYMQFLNSSGEDAFGMPAEIIKRKRYICRKGVYYARIIL